MRAKKAPRTMPQRTYLVGVSRRTVTTHIVYATSRAEALEVAKGLPTSTALNEVENLVPFVKRVA